MKCEELTRLYDSRKPSWQCAVLVLTLLITQTHIQAQSRVPTQPTSYNDLQRLRRLESQFEQMRQLLKIPGMSVAIVKDDKILWSKGFGYADILKRIPTTPRTVYYIASLTKTFATTVLMQLVEQGKLDLDDPMSKYSGEFKDDSVKVKHVLSHTADAPIGERFRYDGARFATLTAVIEKKTSKSFRDVMTEMFLDPLEMRDSIPSRDTFEVAAKNPRLYDKEKLRRYRLALARYAKPYRLYGDEIIYTSYPWVGISAAAGLLSTAPDLAKFLIAIDRHVYIRPETQARSWTPFVSNSGKTLPHGLGWFVQDYQGVRSIWHFGYDPFEFSGTIVKVPDEGLSLVLLANSDALSSPFVRRGILHTSPFVASFLRLFVFEDRLGHALPDPNWGKNKEEFERELAEFKQRGYSYESEQRAAALIRDWIIENKRSALKAVAVNPEPFDAFVGEYELPDGRVLIVSREGNHLMVQQKGESKIEMFAASSTRFFTKAVDAEFAFVKDRDGKVIHMELYQGGTVILKKIK
jgi:CubicO group peptidase (beta-lactamase class C family)